MRRGQSFTSWGIGQEQAVALRARRTGPAIVRQVRDLHHAGKRDLGIAEELGLTGDLVEGALLVWHIRQRHVINRHR